MNEKGTVPFETAPLVVAGEDEISNFDLLKDLMEIINYLPYANH